MKRPSAFAHPPAKRTRSSPLPQPVKVWTDFSGMDAPLMALDRLKVPFQVQVLRLLCHHHHHHPHRQHQHHHHHTTTTTTAMQQVIASSDIDVHVRKFWMARWGDKPEARGAAFYSDVAKRDHARAIRCRGRPDVYVAGFPCPTFSAAGLNQGIDVEKGQMIIHIMKFLRVALPRLVLLENVGGLVDRHKAVLNWILKRLSALSYEVHHSVLNSMDHGVPQSRRRLWIIAIRKDSVTWRSIFHANGSTRSVVCTEGVVMPMDLHALWS